MRRLIAVGLGISVGCGQNTHGLSPHRGFNAFLPNDRVIGIGPCIASVGENMNRRRFERILIHCTPPPQSQYNAKEYIDEILTKDIPRGRRSMAGKTLYPLEFRLSMYMGTSAGKAAGMMVPKLNMVWILHVQD